MERDGIQREPETRRVINREDEKFHWRAFRIVRCDDVHLVADLLQVREHLLVSVGVATDMGGGGGLHEPNLKWCCLLERRQHFGVRRQLRRAHARPDVLRMSCDTAMGTMMFLLANS